MTDNEFIFYWLATFVVWNIYYLWIVPKRAAHFWAQRFKEEKGQSELVVIADSIINAVVERSEISLEDALEAFKASFFGSLGKNIQDTKKVIDMVSPEASIIEGIAKDNPIMGLVMNKLAPQLNGLLGDIGQGKSETSESFRKGL
tara:strand:- start:2541 stop:2975 length:435 start_codon:yes stop_codon:yes gene_type:complete